MGSDLEPRLWHRLLVDLSTVSKNYDWLNKILSMGCDDKVRSEIIKFVKKDDVILELGPGNGVLAEKINCREYWGLDPLKSMIELARMRVKRKSHKFKIGIAEKIPFENEKFDKVICSFSFRDFKHKVKAVKEIYRVLRNNGKLIILDLANGKNPIKYLFLTYFKFLNSCIGNLVKRSEFLGLDSFIDSIKKLISPEDLSKLLRSIGFRKIRIKYLILGAVFFLVAEK